MIYSPEVSQALTRSLGHGTPRGDGSTPLVAGFNACAAGGSRDELIYSEPCAKTLLAHPGRGDEETESFVAGFNAYAAGGSETGYSPGLSVPVRGGNPPAAVIPFSAAQVTSPHNRNRCEPGEPAHTLASSGPPESIAEVSGAWVRRLTVRECERLQGFPDGWTQVAGVSTSARYKALGNAVAVPVVEWIARRLP